MKTSKLSNKSIKSGEEVRGTDIRSSILELIQGVQPDFQKDDYLSIEELNHFRRLYMANLISEEHTELSAIDNDVLKAIRDNSILSENIQEKTDDSLTFGQRVADKIAVFGGSWTFIIVFFSFILVWMMINILFLSQKAFDPYPFILLNLILSCLAAIQAPIIMMSQNRQEQKDRQRSETDYKINLKAELEIKLLSEKIDHLLVSQNKKLLEIQEVQVDYLEDLMREIKQLKSK